MPHKKAKRSVRQQERTERGRNLAPSSLKLDAEEIPKGAARIINAASVQQKYREDMKKRAREDDDGPVKKRRKVDKGELELKIKVRPGESMGHFNRRVEDHLRPNLQAARTTARKADVKPKQPTKGGGGKDANSKAAAAAAAEKERPPSSSPEPTPIKDFATATTTKRVRDVVQAPPTFAGDKFSARLKAKLGSQASSKAEGVVSAAQARMMELEREKAIAHYRALKAAKMSAQQQQQS
ncbi:hypothetical protein BKA62DRAFT_623688 [Auriculariales sp. MPI-PUGE-AT-0066]|nr:hypothetical protein BKA62DRAFT_623688 [Auriculariales sp. MPI-PUGE-AT-0066]